MNITSFRLTPLVVRFLAVYPQMRVEIVAAGKHRKLEPNDELT